MKIYAKFISFEKGIANYFDLDGVFLKEAEVNKGPKALNQDMKTIIEKEREFRAINKKNAGPRVDQIKLKILRATSF